jgi:hypothetical protein
MDNQPSNSAAGTEQAQEDAGTTGRVHDSFIILDGSPETVTSNTITTNTSTATTAISYNVDPSIRQLSSEIDNELQQKRTALAGQWRTPPTPFFPSGGTTGTNLQIDHSPPAGVSVSLPLSTTMSTAVENGTPHPSLPNSTEDYAKALQEAYRRGAEAAARAAAVAVQQQQQQQQQLASVASYPDFAPLTISAATNDNTSALQPQSQPPPPSGTTAMGFPSDTSSLVPPPSMTTGNIMATTAPVDATNYAPYSIEQQSLPFQVVHHHHHHHMLPAPPSNNSTVAGMTGLSPDIVAVDPSAMISTAAVTTSSPIVSSLSLGTNPTDIQPINVLESPPPLTTLHQPSTDLTGLSRAANPTPILPTTATTQLETAKQQQQQQRSVSLPDMSSYAAQQEDEKRQKRLARNRASARLRRLRKKNLVDAYEVEVGCLEKTMAQLQQHEWGCTNSSNTTGVQSALVLAEALSMDRGQQKLSVSERKIAATDILQQQLQFLQQLEDLMQEQYVLQQVAQSTVNGDDRSSNEWKDLQDTLQLSHEQCQQIIEQSSGWDNEWQALQTVKASLVAMKDNNWLWNEGCAGITDQFMSILHSNQITKLLLWADHNAEAIEELDSVHAINTIPDTPIFQFGMDSNANELADDERVAV